MNTQNGISSPSKPYFSGTAHPPKKKLPPRHPEPNPLENVDLESEEYFDLSEIVSHLEDISEVVDGLDPNSAEDRIVTEAIEQITELIYQGIEQTQRLLNP